MNPGNFRHWKSVLVSAVGVTALAVTLFGVNLERAVTPSANAQVGYSVDLEPEWNDKGQLMLPRGFRQWVYLGAPFTPHALNDGAANFPEFHNVYVQPGAFKHYRKTGKWLEGTMFLKELQLVSGEAEFEDGSRYEPSGRGYFPGAVNGIDVAVKDSVRFKESQNWGYFNFGHHAPPYAAAATAAPIEACAQCHIDNADEDMVYVNMYKPILDPLPMPK